MERDPRDPNWHPNALWRLRMNIDYLDYRAFGRIDEWDWDTRFEALMDTGEIFPPVYNPPRPDRALLPPHPHDRSDWRNYARDRYAFHILGRTDDGAGQTEDRAFNEAVRGYGLEFKRILGAGSQGLAMLFEYEGANVVVKTSTAYGGMVAEMWAMRHLMGAKHIVQRRYIPRLGDKGVSNMHSSMMDAILSGIYDLDQLANNAGLELDDNPYLFYCMEFAKHGTLNGILIKSSKQQSRLKSKDIWHTFYCLFRGCIGLAYPDNWDGGLDPTTNLIPTQEEMVPLSSEGTPRDTKAAIMDMDMNDRNVMIASYDFDEPSGGHDHSDVPVFKIGDLGIARSFRTPFWQRHATARLFNMTMGNPMCQAPESWSEGWKNVKDWATFDAEETAGKFGWKTNLWQVGQLMNIMITQSVPEVPPNCYPVSITKPDGQLIQVWTEGSHLLYDPAFTHIDQSLRETVAWCMAHRPADRPEMLELEGIFRTAMQRNFPNEHEAEHRETISGLLNSPPPPRSRLWTQFPFPSNNQEARAEAMRNFLDVMPQAEPGLVYGFPFPLGGADGEEKRDMLRRMIDSTPQDNPSLWSNFVVPDVREQDM